MKDQWFYSREGQEHGPFSRAALAAMAARGDVLPTDLLRPEGTRDWRLASEFSELFPVKESPAPSPEETTSPRDPLTSDPSSLKGLTMAMGIEPIEPGQDPLLGRDIGGVMIVRLIAEGGMGRVYEGQQEMPRRKVAVKVMRPGLISREASQRFGLELEILGRLRHPSIAQIFSAGMCDVLGSKVPFFVMEYIPDALPITRYSNEKLLGVKDRLALFQKVCDAVAHGHEHGVVHRDLKPSNILVEPTGLPKIIDFGIARTVTDSPDNVTALTELGQLIGTLQYMSPEQITADPAAIDTRTDVYALGVILYELLTGKRPYEIASNQIFEAARIVREQKPVSPLKLNQKLSPDIVRVTGTCLQKDRMNRYANASELAVAVGNCLADTAPPVPRGNRRNAVGWQQEGRPWPRRLWPVVMAGLVLGAGAALAYWYRLPAPAEPIVVMDFATPSSLDGFSTNGDVRIASGGGLEIGGRRVLSFAVTGQDYSYPIRVEYDVVGLPDGAIDVEPGLFGSDANWRSGINLHWGVGENTRTLLYVFNTTVELPHQPIVAGRTYRIGIEVDRDRQLKIDRDGKELYRVGLSDRVQLQGPVMLGGGLGHVLYKQVRIMAGGPATTTKTATDRPTGVPEEAIFHAGSWYWFPKKTVNFTEATVEALKAGGRLLMIESTEENQFVAEHMHGPTWLGITFKNGRWVEVGDDSHDQKFFHWNPGQPSRGLGETACAITPDGDGRWHDYFPGDQLYFVVEWH